MKTFKGKAIYNPSGKAGEYAEWACNFYNGCSNGCAYCYCKKGLLSRAMSGDEATLQACFRDEDHAMELFGKELRRNLPELQRHGLFFSFSTDPLLPRTMGLTFRATEMAVDNGVSVKVLTKRADMARWAFAGTGIVAKGMRDRRERIAVGFTLTGHDELEQGASPNAERVEAMRAIHKAGFRTFASIEPIIDPTSSARMITECQDCCDLFKIGPLGGKRYDWLELRSLMLMCFGIPGSRFYFKDGFLSQADVTRNDLPMHCVGRDYNLFKGE